jgi:hypothetical protein
LLVALITLSACSGGSDEGGNDPLPLPSEVTISGIVQYEFPPPHNVCNGLNFNAVQVRPIRQATVQLIDANSMAVLDSSVSDDSGSYSLTVDPQTDVFVRVRAELKNTDPSWDVEVRNNVIDPGDPNPPALENRPIYVMDGSTFNSGSQSQVRNLTAATGWGGNSFTEARTYAGYRDR